VSLSVVVVVWSHVESAAGPQLRHLVIGEIVRKNGRRKTSAICDLVNRPVRIARMEQFGTAVRTDEQERALDRRYLSVSIEV